MKALCDFEGIQLAITCLKLAMETFKQGVKYVQSLQQRNQKDANGVTLESLLLTLNIFLTLF